LPQRQHRHRLPGGRGWTHNISVPGLVFTSVNWPRKARLPILGRAFCTSDLRQQTELAALDACCCL
jgi:hypothetical protein